MSTFFFNVLLNIFQIRIKFLWSTMYVDLLVLCVAVYFFRGQFACEISLKVLDPTLFAIFLKS